MYQILQDFIDEEMSRAMPLIEKEVRDKLFNQGIEQDIEQYQEEDWKEGWKEGWEEGLKEGWKERWKKNWKEGWRNQAVATARRMLKYSELPIDQIAFFNGLTVEEVKAIAEEMGVSPV